MKHIPEAALSQHVAILGKTGAGKTTVAKLAIEQVVADGARVCILDPIKSDWWGLTSSADGKRPGLPFHILGGPRGHVPLHASAGRAIGEIVASGALPLSIIDMADFAPGGQQQFFVDFAPTLLKRMRGVVYLVLEEAHLFAPKERSGLGAENMAIHWAKMLATAGRSKGIRLMLATQRTQSLHNALLGSCDTMIALRMTAPADQAPVLTWLKANVDAETRIKVASSLSSLRTGTGWVCSGEARIFEQVAFPKNATYDNTATPTHDSGEHDVTMATVDHEGLRAIIGNAIAEAEQDDPKLLRAKIAELQRELAKPREPAVDVGALTEAERRGRARGYAAAIEALTPTIDRITTLRSALDETVGGLLADLQAWQRRAPSADVVEYARTAPVYASTAAPAHENAASMHGEREAPVARAPRQREPGAAIPKAERLILAALAQYPQGRSKTQVAILTGYAKGGGSFNNAIGALRSKGWIEGPGDALTITQAGIDALGPYDPLPRGHDLLEHWLGQLGKAERTILNALADAYPGTLNKAEIGQRTGYEPGGGSFNNALGRLRTLELITGAGHAIRASEEFFG